MFLDCSCGTRNSAFNPRCIACGLAIVEGAEQAEVSTRAALRPGSLLAGYVLEEQLGAGTIGRVFRARGAERGEPVAIKVLHPHLLRSHDVRARFVREAAALSGVVHPSVGRLHDVLIVDEMPLLVFEHYEGRTLRRVLDARATFATAEAAAVLRSLAEALGAIHEAGWVHRDVKPENVMLLTPDADAPRELRLLDFGLARSLEPNPESVLTGAGVFVGSLPYAAPEQLFGEEVGPFTDWWALGVVAFEMLAGRRPFQGATKPKLAAAILREDFDALGLDGPLAPWVKRRLSKAPAERGRDWREVIAELP